MDGRQLPHWGAEIEATLMVIFSSYIKIKGPVSCSSSTQQGYKRRGFYKNHRKMFLPLWSLEILTRWSLLNFGIFTALSVRIVVLWEVMMNNLLEFFYFSKKPAAFIFIRMGFQRWKRGGDASWKILYLSTRWQGSYTQEHLHVGNILSSSIMIVISFRISCWKRLI